MPKEGPGGYVESITIPSAPREVVLKSIEDVVRSGHLWLVAGPVGYCGESPGRDLLTDEAALQLPPAAVRAIDILPSSLPGGWNGERTTAAAILAALSEKLAKPLPWRSVVNALNDAFGAGLLERLSANVEWPCDRGIAHALEVGLVVRKTAGGPPDGAGGGGGGTRPQSYRKTLTFDSLASLQSFLDDISSDLSRTAAGNSSRISLSIEIWDPGARLDSDVVAKLDGILKNVR
jgi:hypothetical protein